MKYKIIYLIVGFVCSLLIGIYIYKTYTKEDPYVRNFEECVAAGYPVAESYPRQCRTFDNLIFTEDLGNKPVLSDLVKLDTPLPNSEVTSPLEIQGRAPGNWFFESSFSVYLYDADENIIGTGVAYRLPGDWDVEDFIPFSTQITFNEPATDTGTLVFRKANPSGLPENDDKVSLPVSFVTISNNN